MPEMEKKVRSIRADDEVFAKFRKVCEDAGGQQEALSALISAYELSSAKKILSGQADSITDFQIRIDGIMQSYISVLEIMANTDERVREEFRLHLDTQTRTINNLQEQYQNVNKILSEKSEAYQARTDELERNLAGLKEQLEGLRKSEAAAVTARDQSEKIAAMSSKRVEQLEAEVDDLRAKAVESDKNRKRADTLAAEKENLQDENERLKAEIEKIKLSMHENEEMHQKDIEMLLKKAEDQRLKDEETHKKEVEVEVRLAKAEIRELFIEKIEKIQNDHAAQLAQLIAEAQNRSSEKQRKGE